LIHTDDAAITSDIVVLAFGVEFPSGAVVVEWLDEETEDVDTTQNGLTSELKLTTIYYTEGPE
jgi:hypothetical protein